MTKRAPYEMMFPTRLVGGDTTVHRSGVFDEAGKEWVVACGYSVATVFGYFVVKEFNDGKEITYSEQADFLPKQNEKTYQQALTKLKEIARNQKR